VIELTGSSSRIIHAELPADDPRQRCPDISLAVEKLSWRPTVQLREGLAKTIEHFRSIDLREFRPPTDPVAYQKRHRTGQH